MSSFSNRSTIPGFSDEKLIARRKDKMLKEFEKLFPDYNKRNIKIPDFKLEVR